MAAPIIGRVVRFGLVGLLTTALSYAVFVTAIHLGVHYLLASALAWASGVGLSFVLNKRFTFAVRTRADLREAASFLAGYVLQLIVGTAGYAVLIGGLGLKPTPAFAVNLVITSGFSFLYMQTLVFTGRGKPRESALAAPSHQPGV